MALQLDEEERFGLSDDAPPWLAMAMRIVTETASLLGARRLVPITSAHIDGCLYQGEAGVYFVERLCHLGARVTVPTSLNVGALDLIHPDIVTTSAHHRGLALRQMRAYEAIGCAATWTCAPYQVGYRPRVGEHVAWAESNAVAFVNSVLGARSNRNGDFLDIACALSSRAPYCGLHVTENRAATVIIDVLDVPTKLVAEDAFYPVLGALLGNIVGAGVAVIDGLPKAINEDRLKALGAAAASSGAVGLFHVAGVTPEAPSVEVATGGKTVPRINVTTAMLREARDRLSTDHGFELDCVALGSPHFSLDECHRLQALIAGKSAQVPIYVCTSREVLARLEHEQRVNELEANGVIFVIDTCVVVTPILKGRDGVMMTNSAKFAHYAPANTGYRTVFGSLADCVRSAIAGHIERDEQLWQ